jgi:hypothetical protein
VPKRRLKIFWGAIISTLIKYPNREEFQDQVNEFLALDGDKINVLDVQYQFEGGLYSVMVYYEVL